MPLAKRVEKAVLPERDSAVVDVSVEPVHSEKDGLRCQSGRLSHQAARGLRYSIALRAVSRRFPIHADAQLIHRKLDRQQPDVGLYAGAITRTEFDQIFRSKRLLGATVERFDVRPLQPHHVESQPESGPGIVRIAPYRT